MNISQDLAGGETLVNFQTHADFFGLNQPEVVFGISARFGWELIGQVSNSET